MSKRFNKMPFIEVKNTSECYKGWKEISDFISQKILSIQKENPVIVLECYQGVILEEILSGLQNIQKAVLINAMDAMHEEDYIKKMVYPDVTDDRIFGYLSRLNIEDFYDDEKLARLRCKISDIENEIVIVYGTGASQVVNEPDILIYADMARWEIQLRMREHKVNNIGVKNKHVEDWMLLYKQGFFVDWRACDRLKKKLFNKIDYLLDTNIENNPKLIEYKDIKKGLKKALNQPFSVVPFFDPGPWGGQWMKEKFNLDKNTENFAWCFNCVPEENSLLLKINDEIIEIPSINLVFMHPRELLGDPVHARFGDEFPIRFDYLDTMDGGNLSLQVHPLTEYIQENFGMHYTQDESYYMMDAKDEAFVYLGLKEGVNPEAMINELQLSKETGKFNVEKHVEKWPVKKHDHFLIPGGTVHCSGVNSMVLEISATPYIFTFKLWDWGRLGLDGKPRPINIEHGEKVIQWHRTTNWTKKELVNRIEKISEGDGWREEKTGLHEREFIETRRHWFSNTVCHNTNGGVNVLNLVEGEEIIVESPKNVFKPFVVHYAETFIVPAAVGEYTIKPFGKSEGKECATIKAYVRV